MRVSIGELRRCWGNDQIQETRHIDAGTIVFMRQLKLDIACETSDSRPEQQLRRSGAPIASFVVVQVNTETSDWARSRSDKAIFSSLTYTIFESVGLKAPAIGALSHSHTGQINPINCQRRISVQKR